MSEPDMVGWFDGNWYPTFRRLIGPDADTLARKDRVFALVGAVIDAILGSDVSTLYEQEAGRHAVEMAEAFATIGLNKEADALRAINAAFPGGHPARDDAQREKQIEALPDEAWQPWRIVYAAFDEWAPGGNRVMLTRLFELYHTPTD